MSYSSSYNIFVLMSKLSNILYLSGSELQGVMQLMRVSNFNEVFALRGSNITIQQWNMQICAQETTVRSQGSWDWVFYSKTHLMS